MSRNNPVAISLFAGAGGLDLGVTRAGCRVAAAVELDGDAATTMEQNLRDLEAPVIRADLREVTTAHLLGAAGLAKARPDLLVGGPPCTPFSKSGYWLDYKREGRDPRASLLDEYVRVLRESRPRAFILENVYSLTYNNLASRPAFDRLLAGIVAAGYDPHWAVLNAADFGVPQLRPRLFVVGRPTGEPQPSFPRPTHTGPWERRRLPRASELRPHVTAVEALDGVSSAPEEDEEVRGRWGALLEDIPPGGNYLHYTKERGHPAPLFSWRSRYWSFLLKLDPSRPSPTIQAQPGPYVGPFHWENRRIRIPELKRLFTFPDDFEFSGSAKSIRRQVGNAVPPLLSCAVASAVVESLT
jgi:DNA (cytosine-5)-methyltransferase 1